jgi:hypothetical protein
LRIPDRWIEVIDLDIVAIGISGREHAARTHIPHLAQDFDRLGLPLSIDCVGILDGEARDHPAVDKRDAGGGSGGVLQSNIGLLVRACRKRKSPAGEEKSWVTSNPSRLL